MNVAQLIKSNAPSSKIIESINAGVSTRGALLAAVRFGAGVDVAVALIKRSRRREIVKAFECAKYQKVDPAILLALLKRIKKPDLLGHGTNLCRPECLPVVKALKDEHLKQPVWGRDGKPETLYDLMRAKGASPIQCAYASPTWRSLCVLVPYLPADVLQQVWARTQ